VPPEVRTDEGTGAEMTAHRAPKPGAARAPAADRALIRAVRETLAAHGDPERGTAQQAYMKSAMPFAGVELPEVRRATRQAAAAHPLAGWAAWRDTVLALWREAGVREERYAALALAGLPTYRAHARSLRALRVYDELIADGAWWDHVDEVATHFIGPLLLAHPTELAPVIRAWSRDGDRWRRRAAVICQVGAKDRTDVGLLADCIEANLADPDFFVRKAIGWALRQHARTDPAWVRVFVAAHDRDLSGLSRREALRHLGEAGSPPAVGTRD